MAGDFDGVRVVVAAPRDCAHSWPAFKRKTDSCSTVRAELHEDLLLARVGNVLLLAQLTRVELYGVDFKDGLCIEGGACDPLTEGAVAREGTNRRLVSRESDLAAETATFKRRHGDHPNFVNGESAELVDCEA
jgi:hypothetical protein